ncbi:MAG: DEAD/DEAH box helicase, partial [Lentisphaeria bacterium]
VLVPTRELAEQVADSFRTYGRTLNISVAAIFGGVQPQRQIKALKDGVHVVVATPGRFLDLYEHDELSLDNISYFVLDEADKMLDMGFLPDIEKVMAKLPHKRQTALFSATMPPQITFMAENLMNNPKSIKVSDGSLIASNIDMRVMYMENANKSETLKQLLIEGKMRKVIIFGRTKLAVEREAQLLQEAGLTVGTLHGDKFQRDRKKIIEQFQAGDIDILFATDVASRGLDITGISHVINFNVPEDPEDFIHRVGRTARAGKRGIALTLCGRSERKLISNIEHYINIRLSVFRAHKFHSYEIEKMNLKGSVKEKNQRSASGMGKHRRVTKDRRSAAKKLAGIKVALKPEGKEERITLSQAKEIRKKKKQQDKKQSAITDRLKKYYRP